MIPRRSSALFRIGAVALLTATGVAVAPSAAQAADTADLSLVPSSGELARGVREAKAKPFKFTVYNSGPAAAQGVTVVVDLRQINTRRVGAVLPDGCKATRRGYRCDLGAIPAGTSAQFGVPLFSVGGKGDGGTLSVRVTGATGDPNDDDNAVDVPITVTKPGYDLTAWAEDVYADADVDAGDTTETDLTPVTPGDTADLDWAVYNHGSRRAEGLFYGIGLPAGVTFETLPAGCVENPIDGLAVAYCDAPAVVLRPGEYYTEPIRVRVDEDAEGPVLTPGVLFAAGLTDTGEQSAAARSARSGRPASARQRAKFAEVDEVDNSAIFDVFVGPAAQPTATPTAQPTPTVTPSGDPQPTPSLTAAPTPSPTDDGDGGTGGGGLPTTGAQAGLLGGVGLGVVAVGGVLFALARRRRLVLVSPDDEGTAGADAEPTGRA